VLMAIRPSMMRPRSPSGQLGFGAYLCADRAKSGLNSASRVVGIATHAVGPERAVDLLRILVINRTDVTRVCNDAAFARYLGTDA
jgi:hypothetical protein